MSLFGATDRAAAVADGAEAAACVVESIPATASRTALTNTSCGAGGAGEERDRTGSIAASAATVSPSLSRSESRRAHTFQMALIERWCRASAYAGTSYIVCQLSGLPNHGMSMINP